MNKCFLNFLLSKLLSNSIWGWDKVSPIISLTSILIQICYFSMLKNYKLLSLKCLIKKYNCWKINIKPSLEISISWFYYISEYILPFHILDHQDIYIFLNLILDNLIRSLQKKMDSFDQAWIKSHRACISSERQFYISLCSFKIKIN